jgi:hypothetical protein
MDWEHLRVSDPTASNGGTGSTKNTAGEDFFE